MYTGTCLRTVKFRILRYYYYMYMYMYIYSCLSFTYYSTCTKFSTGNPRHDSDRRALKEGRTTNEQIEMRGMRRTFDLWLLMDSIMPDRTLSDDVLHWRDAR